MTVVERAIPNSSDVEVTIDTTSGATSYPLPAGYAGGRSVRVRHSKGSTAATVTVVTGGSIDDAVNGTISLGVDQQVTLESGGDNTWQSYGGGGASGSYLAYVGTTASPVTNTATSRPATTGPVLWLCGPGVTPTNALDGDLIVNKSA